MNVPSLSSGLQQTLAFLQAQTAHYVPAVNGQGDQEIADFKELQTDVDSGNEQAALAALAQLREEEANSSASESPAKPAPSSHLQPELSFNAVA